MKTRILLSAALLVTVALSLTIANAFGVGGRLALYLVNTGSPTTFYNVTDIDGTGECPSYLKPASLSTNQGTGVQHDSPGYAFTENPLEAHPSTFSYTVPAGGGFTLRAKPHAIILKLWAFSGDGTCGGQDGDQTIDWRVYCNGSCGSNVSLTGPGQVAKPGWQAFEVPAGTPINSLFTNSAGPSSAVTVGAGDVITLELSADTWAGIQWSDGNGAGVSALFILKG